MKAGNCEHEHGVILDRNRIPDEMYMATQPINKPNISHCLQEATRLPGGRQRIPIPAAGAASPPASPVAHPAPYGRNGRERGAAHLFVSVAGEAQREEECLARPPVSRRYGPGKGEDWLIARAVGFYSLISKLLSSGLRGREEGRERSQGCFRDEGRREDVVLASRPAFWFWATARLVS